MQLLVSLLASVHDYCLHLLIHIAEAILGHDVVEVLLLRLLDFVLHLYPLL